jgi:hypothetical protein
MCTSPTQPAFAGQGIVFAAPAPGGAARQFRVQVSSADESCRWHLYASFRDGTAARTCLEKLRKTGTAARLVVYHSLPCAA